MMDSEKGDPPDIPENTSQSVGLPRPIPAKEKRTTDELAAMILSDLRKVEGCPKQGVKVTVYGSNPWNCWLTFDVGALVPNKAELQTFCNMITDRLKRLYDV